LEKTHRLGVCRTPADVDDDGYAAAAVFVRYFVEHRSGLVQAESEGFYEGDRLIAELR
jgi:hypothetical protein